MEIDEQKNTFIQFSNISFYNFSYMDIPVKWKDYDDWQELPENDLFIWHRRTRRILLGFVLSTCIFAGIIGNILVIYSTVKKCRHENSAFHVFLVNLCTASLVLLVFEYPLIIYENVFTQPWRLGEFFCQLHGYIQYCTYYGVSYALVLVMIFRLLQVIIPDVISKMNNKCTATIVCAVKWCIIMIANIPTWIGHGLYDEIEGSLFCYHKQLNENKLRLHSYLVIHFIFAFSLPALVMVVIAVILILIAIKLPPGSNYDNFNSEDSNQNIQRNTNIMLVSLIVAYIICWAPTNIFILLLGFDYLDFRALIKLSIMSDVFMCFACANPCMNPWLIFIALYREFQYPWGRNNTRQVVDNQSTPQNATSVSNGHLQDYTEERSNSNNNLYSTEIEMNC